MYTHHIAMRKNRTESFPFSIFSMVMAKMKLDGLLQEKSTLFWIFNYRKKNAVPMVIVMSNGMVQTMDADGRRIVDFKLLEKSSL